MNPITLIPWQQDFIPALGEHLIQRDDFSDLIVLFPHNRPRRYLKTYFTDHPDLPRPIFLPHMISIAEFITGLRQELVKTPVTQAHQLDLVELLRKIVNDLRSEGRGLLARLPELDREAFLPWGIRLAKLMDDLLHQNIEPDDLTYMEGDVSPYAAALLEQIGAIHHAYITRLFERDGTTSGLDWRFITGNITDVTKHLQNKQIIAAGFYALSGAEDLFFRRLWEDGILHPIIHSDPSLASNTTPHWSVAEHIAWQKRWKTPFVLPADMTVSEHAPTIRFCEGYDRHSQLSGLAGDLESSANLDVSAVVLPDEGALLPVLHHLPDKEPNISMGYPLDRTSLARLVETLLTLQENKLEDGRYYWRDVIALIRHPYLRLLGPEEKPLRSIFHHWESLIRDGDKYFDPLTWEPPYTEDSLADIDKVIAEPLRKELLFACLQSFENANTLAQLGDCLADLAALLHKHGEKLWQTYLVDAECLFRLTSSVVPQLKSAEASSEQYSKPTLYSLLRQMIAQERVSFEPEPLAGLQVLGVLETRLLHFKRLFILDAIEERLPGTNPYDPLLPDPLRKLLGLPDARERDNVSGYNFYRLLMGADEAVIYYQNGIQPGLLDSKSVRSRFVEQLLWEQEKKDRKLIEAGDSTIKTVTFPTSSIPSGIRSIPITDAIHSSLKTSLEQKGLSPSRLDQYMSCPKQFFYSYLTSIRPLVQIDEDGDRSEFGSLIHEVLREFFKPYIGRTTDFGKLDPMPLLTLFDEVFTASDFFSRLPLDTRMALTRTGRYRLEEFLKNQECTTLIGLEESMEASINERGLLIPFRGQLDRIERKESGIVIMDYKTGGGAMPLKGFWDDLDLWDRISAYNTDVADPLLLMDVTKAVHSIQLPAYLHLFVECKNEKPYDAGLIKLSDNGKSQYLFGPKWTEEERTEAVDDMTPLLIKTLIRHMLDATQFPAQPGPRCQWCDFKTPCGQ